MILDASTRTFPSFSLPRLLTTCFGAGAGERVCILIDLPNPADVEDFKFLRDETLSIQNYGHEIFYKGFQEGVLETLNWTGGELYAYKETGGSNLDMEDVCYDVAGNLLSLDKDIYTNYDIILTVLTFSATAPLTAKCKEFGFRGATLHGLNQIILDTGLAVDYDIVSEEAERIRSGLTQADRFEIDFEVESKVYTGGHFSQTCVAVFSAIELKISQDAFRMILAAILFPSDVDNEITQLRPIFELWSCVFWATVVTPLIVRTARLSLIHFFSFLSTARQIFENRVD